MDALWDASRHTLGVAAMDATHHAFCALADRLAAADEAAFAPLFAELLAHTREHFAAEDTQMKAIRFSALGEHLAEHQRVLAELRSFQRAVLAGRTRMARAYVGDHLRAWFDLHLATMDAALAAHLRKLGAG